MVNLETDLSISVKKSIRDLYEKKLSNIFTTILNKNSNKQYPRIIVSIIHNDEDLGINAEEREILHSIQSLLGENWIFRECLYGKCLQCNFKNLEHDPDFSNIYPEYKKAFMIRMNLITETYDLRFKTNIKYIKYEPQYHILKKRINELKGNTITHLRNMIKKIPSLNKDVCNLIYDFSKENLKKYYELRKDIEDLRKTLLHITDAYIPSYLPAFK